MIPEAKAMSVTFIKGETWVQHDTELWGQYYLKDPKLKEMNIFKAFVTCFQTAFQPRMEYHLTSML